MKQKSGPSKAPAEQVLKCSSSDNLRPIRHCEKGGLAHQGLEFKRPAVGAASDGLRWWQV
jgi:hypothetical protein